MAIPTFDFKIYEQLTKEQRDQVEETLARLRGFGPPEHAIAACILRGVTPEKIVALWDAWVAKFNGDAAAAQAYQHNFYQNYLYAPLLGQEVVEPFSEPTNLGKLTINENEILDRLLRTDQPLDLLGQPINKAQRDAYKALLLALSLRDRANVEDQARAAWIFTPAAPSIARSIPSIKNDTYGAYMKLLGSTNPSAGLAGFNKLGLYLYLTGKLHGFYGFTFDAAGNITGMNLLQRQEALDGNEIYTLPDGREVPKSLSAYARDVCKAVVAQNPGTKMPDDDGIELG